MARWVWLSTALMMTSISCAQRDAHSRTPVDTIGTTIAVWPDTITLSRGDTLRLRAIAQAAGDVVLNGRDVTWSTSDSSIVSITDGLATARRRGSATIMATSNRTSGSARVNVVTGGGSVQQVPLIRPRQPTRRGRASLSSLPKGAT